MSPKPRICDYLGDLQASRGAYYIRQAHNSAELRAIAHQRVQAFWDSEATQCSEFAAKVCAILYVLHDADQTKLNLFLKAVLVNCLGRDGKSYSFLHNLVLHFSHSCLRTSRDEKLFLLVFLVLLQH